MPVPNTNVTFSSIQTEFGGSIPISISEYYRGGTYVPNGTAAVTDGSQISTSGLIRVGMFRGTSSLPPAGTVRSSGAGIWSSYDMAYAGATALAGITFNSNGTVTLIGNQPGTQSSWNLSAPVTGIGGNYWMRATRTAGTTGFVGVVGTWQSMSTSRSYTVDESLGQSGTTSVTLTFEWATDSAGTNIVATHTGNTFIANSDPGPIP